MCKKFIFPVSLILLGAMVGNAWSIEIASNPSPSDGATCVDPDTYLSWSPGIYGNKHDLYLGTNFDDVSNATTLTAGIYEGRQDSNSFNPGDLEESCKTYYWRIDEVHDCEPNIWKGDVWSFTTKGDDCCHCIVPPEGMVAWWPFDEEPGTTIANDIAGSINDQGTLINGASFTSGMVEGGLLLDGVNDYVEAPDSPELNFGEGNLSVDMWVNLVPTTSGTRTIIDKRTIGSTVQGYTVYILEGKLAFQLADAGAASTTCGPDSSCVNYLSGVTIANGEWNHIAVTVDRGQTNGGIWYVNGIEVGNRFNPTFINGSLTNSAPLWISRHANWGSSYIHGILDEIELFNRVLDANEIWAIFKAGSDGKCKCKPAPAYKDDIKWSQPPERNYLGCINGWDEVSIYYNEPIIADDWVCLDDRPIKDIHWWGSFKGWTEPNQVPPAEMPAAFHIGIWTDVPDPDPNDPNNFSHPGKLIWERRCESFVWSYAGCDVDPRNTSGIDACFQFDQLLSQDQWFHQETNEPNGTVYWLSIAAIYDGNVPLHTWGWKTRPHFYNDDAVRITSLGGQWPPVIGSVWAGGEPIEYPSSTSWDMAFVLTTNREYQPMKWWWPNEETRAADIYPDGIINLKDMAVLAGNWLTEGQVWPEWDLP